MRLLRKSFYSKLSVLVSFSQNPQIGDFTDIFTGFIPINAIAALRRGMGRSWVGERKCGLVEVINTAEIRGREEMGSAGNIEKH